MKRHAGDVIGSERVRTSRPPTDERVRGGPSVGLGQPVDMATAELPPAGGGDPLAPGVRAERQRFLSGKVPLVGTRPM